MKYDVKIATCIDDFSHAVTTDIPVISLDSITEDAFDHFIELARMGLISLAFEADNSEEA